MLTNYLTKPTPTAPKITVKSGTNALRPMIYTTNQRPTCQWRLSRSH